MKRRDAAEAIFCLHRPGLNATCLLMLLLKIYWTGGPSKMFMNKPEILSAIRARVKFFITLSNLTTSVSKRH